MAFHIDLAGNTGACGATTGRCPYGGVEDHYESEEDARQSYEDSMAPETLPPLRTTKPTLTRQEAIELDQFFTRDELSVACLETLSDKLESLGYDGDQVHFVEPSAGGGSFVRAAGQVFPDRPVKQGDIAPKNSSIAQLDFINDDIDVLRDGDPAQRIVIGNPPFGYRARLAQDFINRAFELSDTVVFVIPVQFQKYSGQKGVDSDARLVHDERLPYDAFTVNGTPYGVQCCFQIWTKRPGGQDVRIKTPPPQDHPDFSSWIVSSKASSKRHLSEAPWDYAVVTQGFAGQFEVIPRERAEELSPKRQYMLLQANTPEAHERIQSLDFEELASRNTTRIKGFGKADLVEAYSSV